MSFDRAILSARKLPDPASFFEEHEHLLFDEDGGPWEGDLSGISTWVETRDAWDDKRRAVLDELLGEPVACALMLNGRGSNMDGWDDVDGLVEALVDEVGGAYVSLDEKEVLYCPRAEKEEADKKGSLLAAIETAKAGPIDMFASVVAGATKGYVDGLRAELRTRFTAELADAVTSNVDRLAEIADRAAVVHLHTLFYSSGVIHEPDWSDPLAQKLVEAHEMLGHRALSQLKRFTIERTRIFAESAGKAWASANAPSREAITLLLERAKEDDTYARTVIASWRRLLGCWAPDVSSDSLDSVVEAFDTVEEKIATLIAAANATALDMRAISTLTGMFEKLGRRAEMNVWLGLSYMRSSTLFGIAKGKLDIAKGIDPNTPGLAAAYAELESRKTR